MSEPPLPGMDEILQRLVDGQIQPDELERLQKAIREDPRARDYYVDSMLACAALRRSSQVTGELSGSDLAGALTRGRPHAGSRRTVRHLSWAAALLLLGVSAFLCLSLLRHPAQRSASRRLAGAYEAQWRGLRLAVDGPLHAGRYDLLEGAARMELGPGTSVLLEAPCQVELTDLRELILTTGRVVVEVASPAAGFRVRTRTAVVTDLGTEFGVIVLPNGSTEAHVLKGRVRVALDPDRARRPTSLVAREGQATTVDPAGETISEGLPAQPALFLRRLPAPRRRGEPSTRLSLADLVGGGNGRGSGSVDSGIDLGTGEASAEPATTIRRARQNEFLVTRQLFGIDGVFVPNGALGPVVISSTGLTFSDCPDTLGSYYGGPANSGKIYDIPGRRVHTARLNGMSLGTPSRPALSLHPNAGITFDLDEIREENPAVRIERFTAVCGIPRDIPQWPFSPADVWVLLDGVVHLHLRYSTAWSVVEEVDVPIPDGTRFLTLAATCNGRADYSWVFFGEPFLEPEAPNRTDAER